MPDTQTMLDRGYTVAQIRAQCAQFRSLAPKARVGFRPVLDGCNHAR